MMRGSVVGSVLAALTAVGGCREAPTETRLGWEAARIVLAGTLDPPAEGVATELMEVWGARLRLAGARPGGGYALDAARPAPHAGIGVFDLTLSLQVPPPCSPASLRAVADRLWPVLAAPRGAGLHALEPEAAARVADTLRASREVVDVSTAAAHGGLVAMTLAESAQLSGLRELASRAATPALVVLVPTTLAKPLTTGGLARPEVTFAVVSPLPSLGPERVASVEFAAPREGLVRVSVIVRPEAVADLAKLTSAHLGRHLPILDPDGRLLAAPVLATRVRDGRLELRVPATGAPEPHILAAALGAGVLPASPTLTRLEAACGGGGLLQQLPVSPHKGGLSP